MTYTPKPSTPARAGAMDAYKKPSLVMGKPVPHRAPHGGPVGVLKDQRPHHNNA
jgi:hypothetical protein